MNTARLLLLLALAGGNPAAAAPAGSPNPQTTRELVAIVKSGAALDQRAQACQQLMIFGTAEAVPVLGALLPDEKLSHYAREALEVMPYPAAGDALRAALGTLEGRLLIGVVSSVGIRRDAKAVAPLSKLAGDAGGEAAPAALRALGRIATGDATRVLQQTLERGPDRLRAAAAEGCLDVAARHAAEGRREAAISLYDAVRHAPISGQLRATATHGAILARGAAGLPLLLDQLRSSEAGLRNIALLAIREISAPDTTRAIVAELERAGPSLQALLIAALVDRNDPRALAAIEARVTAKEAEVRLAALQALGQIGSTSSVPILLRSLGDARSPAEAGAATASLARISCPDTNAMMVRALPAAPPALRVRLIAVLGERRAREATGELIRLAGGDEPGVIQASFRALTLVAAPADLPELIRLMVAARDDGHKTLAARAIVTAAMKAPDIAQRDDALLAALRQAPDENTKVSLLRPLGAIVRSMGSSAEAFQAVRSARGDPSATVRTAALQCLSDWPDAAPATLLLEVANRSDSLPAERDLALPGAIRMAANVAAGRDRAPLDAVVTFQQANRMVRTSKEKLMIVSGLGSLRQIAAVEMLQPYLDDPEVRTEAAIAILQVAPALTVPAQVKLARTVLEKIAATEKDPDVRSRAAQLLKAGPPSK